MQDPLQLEEAFKEFSENLKKWVPDGIINIDFIALNEMGLLNHEELDQSPNDTITQHFHVVESQDKVTLFNEQFAIWIVPKLTEQQTTTTLSYVARLQQNKPHLELVFSTAGVYNTPKYILKVLEYFLREVIDTEAIISSIGKKQ